MTAKYVNPFTDFGFKKIFGEEASKPVLLDFLNALLPQQAHIKNLTFKNTEQLADITNGRKVIFDIYCENEQGEKFIVELQKAKQDFFRERTIYYSTFPIREQAEKGNWNFQLKAVFCIGILDFTFNDYVHEPEKGQVVHEVTLKDQAGKTFYDKLTYIYLEMPNFTKTEAELQTRLDKWLYFIKHLEDFQSIPQIFKDEVVFIEAFAKAELSKYNKAEMDSYERNLKNYRDLYAVVETAEKKGMRIGRAEGRKEGEAKGKAEGKMEVAKALKNSGIAIDIICKTTGLSKKEVEQL